jgi:hypothetical protein
VWSPHQSQQQQQQQQEAAEGEQAKGLRHHLAAQPTAAAYQQHLTGYRMASSSREWLMQALWQLTCWRQLLHPSLMMLRRLHQLQQGVMRLPLQPPSQPQQ